MALPLPVRILLDRASESGEAVTLGGVEWSVNRRSVQWMLVNKPRGFRLSVGQKQASVMFDAWALWQDGRSGGEPLSSALRCWRWFEAYVREHLDSGGMATFNVTRLDLAADFTGWALTPSHIDKFASTAKQRAPRTFDGEVPGDGLSLEFSGMPRCARVYIKSKEVRHSEKLWFWDVWRLDPASGVAVVRVEFRWGTSTQKGTKGNRITDSLGYSEPGRVLTPGALTHLWLNSTGAPGTLAGWLSLRRGRVVPADPPDAGAALLDPRWEDVQRVKWDNWTSEHGERMAPDSRVTPGDSEAPIRGLLGALGWFARERGVSSLADAIALAIPAVLAEERRRGGSFEGRVRAGVLEHGGPSTLAAGAFVAAMGPVRYEDGRLAFEETPADVAAELWRDLSGTAALLLVRGDPAPWTTAAHTLFREAESSRYLCDRRAQARRTALYKLPLVLTGAPGRDPYALLPPAAGEAHD